MSQSERESAALTSPHTDMAGKPVSVDYSGLDDVYQRAARVYVAARYTYPIDIDARPLDLGFVRALAGSSSFSAAVDAAREDLAAEVARVTAERDQARALLARVRAKAAEWSAEPPWSDISWAPAGTWIVRMIDGEA